MHEETYAGGSDAALAGNIRKTLSTTLQVLDHLEQSLRQAGFAEGRDSYRRMVDTVISQSLWLGSRGYDAIPSELAAVAERARSIHALLHPYAEAMLRLGAVAELGLQPPPSPAGASPETPSEDPLLAALARGGRPMSLTALRSELRWEKQKLTERLAALEKAGLVKKHPSAGRELYLLAGHP